MNPSERHAERSRQFRAVRTERLSFIVGLSTALEAVGPGETLTYRPEFQHSHNRRWLVSDETPEELHKRLAHHGIGATCEIVMEPADDQDEPELVVRLHRESE